MCIEKSVGRGCINRIEDSRAVQSLLNMNGSRYGLARPLAMDGKPGTKTYVAIEAFQRGVAGAAQPDGRVDPGGLTLGLLRQGIASDLTREKLQGIMAGAPAERIELYDDGLKQALDGSSISTPLRLAHFLAQVGHESADLRYSKELASGEAYEGRKDLGNSQPGDGPRFKGRGLIQLTGRANYDAYGKARGEDFIAGNGPERIAIEPFLAVDVAIWFWTRNRINRFADEDDVRQVTKIINGGYNGLEDRKRRLARAKWFLNLE